MSFHQASAFTNCLASISLHAKVLNLSDMLVHAPLSSTLLHSWVQVLQFLGWWLPSVELMSPSVIVRVTPGSWTTWDTPVPSMESEGPRLFPSPGGCSHRPCCSWTPKMWYWHPTASMTLNVCFSLSFCCCSRVEMESWVGAWKLGYSIRSWNVGWFSSYLLPFGWYGLCIFIH